MKTVETTSLLNKDFKTFKEVRETCKALKYKIPEGIEVFRWEEFQRFAQRLGIDVEAPITNLTIEVPVDGLVRVTSVVHGLDTREESGVEE